MCVCVSSFLPYVSSMQCACVVLYCHLWPVWLFIIDLGEGGGGEHTMRVLIFSKKNSVLNVSNSKKNSARYYDELHMYSHSVPVFSGQTLMKL
jgi:hypothetical protein